MESGQIRNHFFFIIITIILQGVSSLQLRPLLNQMYLSIPPSYEAITHVIDISIVDNSEKKVKKVPADCLELVTHRIILNDSLFHPQGNHRTSPLCIKSCTLS
jgi:hypothetical protein